MSGLKDARSNALALGHPVVFIVNADGGQFGIEGMEPKEVPSGIRLSLILSQENVVNSGVGRFVFFPEGGSTGGSVEILRSDDDGTRVRVDWLLGRVSQEALLP